MVVVLRVERAAGVYFNRKGGANAAVAAPQATMGGCLERAKVLFTYTVTACKAHLCGERGSPAVGKGYGVFAGWVCPAKRGQTPGGVWRHICL